MEKIALVTGHRLSVINQWARKNKIETFILGLILLVGAFFRLYRIADYMTFLGDEGRDAIVVRRLLVDFDPILIGPRTSIGDMYLGPLYYYLIAPALLLANFSPVGPSVMVALLGVATIFLVWYVSKEWFSVNGQGRSLHAGALIAAGLYAISPVVITYSKSSWNPNIMPFFALISIFSIWKVWRETNFKWMVVAGLSTAFVLQSHYLGLLLIPTLGLFWLLTFIKTRNQERINKGFFNSSLITLLLFTFLMSPLVLFDARHGWNNFTSMKRFFTERQTTVSLKPWKSLPNIWPIFKNDFITRIVAGTNVLLGKWISIVLIVGLLWLFTAMLRSAVIKKSGKEVSGYFILMVWLVVGLVGLGVYKQHVYDHYFGFLFTAPFILIGIVSEKIFAQKSDGIKIFFTSGLVLLSISNLMNNPLWYEPNYQMRRAKMVAEFIQMLAGDEKFNLAVIAERNYEDGYQYFLEKEGAGVVDIDAQVPETVNKQLFVVCELPEEICDPTHSPKAEVANFGWSRVEDQWRIMGVTIYKLVHSK